MVIYKDSTTTLEYRRDTQGFENYEATINDGMNECIVFAFSFADALDGIGCHAPLSWHGIMEARS